MADRTTHITDDIEFRGEMKFEDRLVIDGKVEGRIESSGKVELNEAAKVKADMKVKELTLKGDLQGNVNAQNTVHIATSGKLTGDIDCKQIQIDKGGTHNGATVMN